MPENKRIQPKNSVTPPGPLSQGLISQFYSQENSANRDNPIGADQGLAAGLPALPKTLDMSYKDSLKEHRLMQEGFIESVFATHEEDYKAHCIS